jgi:hypothetical protein
LSSSRSGDVHRSVTTGRLLWIGALFAALAFTATDATIRLRTIADVQEELPGRPPDDASSSTGYAREQRGLILPSVGIDGYQWIIQTQQMLAGDGLRIRRVDYDNAPAGREVHWSSPFRWWLGGLAVVHHWTTATPLGLSVERVAPAANVLLFAILLVVLVPVVARSPRGGAVAAAVLAAGIVAVRPFSVSFLAGNVDHHGLAAAACLVSVLCIMLGGAGWVPVHEDARAGARRWMIAGGIAGGVGLWISAATITPVLLGLAGGALLSTGVLPRNAKPNTAPDWRPDPTLWRTWAMAGGATSLVAYGLEYFPSNMGWRLEVNHPLFAFAWMGGGVLLWRASEWLTKTARPLAPRDRVVLAASALAALTLPLTIAFARARTFWVADRFLWSLHEGYISEFMSFGAFWTSVPWPARIIDGSVVIGATLVLVALRWHDRTAHERAAIFAVIPAGAFIGVLALRQTRWMVPASAVWLAIMVGLFVAARTSGAQWRARGARAVATALLLAVALLPAPALALREWVANDWSSLPEMSQLFSLVTRQVATSIRARAGDPPPVVLSGPSSTSQLVYYGGLRGIGTLYWENVPGLRATTDILGARSPEEAHRLVQERGITHLVVFSWDTFADEAARLARGIPFDAPVPDDAFLSRILRTGQVPPWLRARRYPLPDLPELTGQWVAIFEVVADSVKRP